MPAAEPADLASLPFFDSLSESERAEVAASFVPREVGAGVQLIGEGTTGHSFFVLLEGEARVTADGDEIATLGSGDFFGELALLATERRTATVITTKPSQVLVLFRTDFERLRTKHPSVAAELEAAMEQRLQRP